MSIDGRTVKRKDGASSLDLPALLDQGTMSNTLFNKYSHSYPETPGKVLKCSDLKDLLSSEDLMHNEFIYLSQIASYIPLDIFNILFTVSDLDNKGYINEGDFQKLSQQLLIPHRNHGNHQHDYSSDPDLDANINKLLFLICKIYENNNSKNPATGETIDSNIYNLNLPISQKIFLQLVESHNSTDFQYLKDLLKAESSDQLLDFKRFSRIMDELPKIKFDSCYEAMKNNNSNISPAQLKQIAEYVFYNKLSSKIADHLEQFAVHKYGDEISYSDAYNLLKMVRDLPKLNYFTYEIISKDCTKTKFYLTTSSLYSYIQAENSQAHPITKDEIQLYFNWNRFTYDNITKNPAINADELLAILTDDMVVPKDIGDTYSKSASSNFFHVFKSIHSFVLGSFAGMIGASIVYPIDIIKTRMQNQKGNSLYSSYIDCFKKLIRNEGIFGLYSGLLPQVIGVAPEKAIKLTLNDLVRGIGKKNSANGDITLAWEILAGSSAGLCQVIVTNPLEVSKIRLQTQGENIRLLKEQGKTVNPKTALQIVQELGPRGLYRGAGACLLRDIPFSSIYFPTYANIKKRIFGLDPGKPGKRSNLEAWELLLSGALAGMPAALLTTPCDVIKTRIQSKANVGVEPYKGIMPTFKRILMEEGPKAFFKGGVARICRSSPQFGFTLAAYEIFQKTLPFSLFYETESHNENPIKTATATTTTATATTPQPPPLSIPDGSKRFKLSSSASAADLNPTLLALTNYYKALQDEKKK